MRFLPFLGLRGLFAMQDLSSRTGREGWEWEELRQASHLGLAVHLVKLASPSRGFCTANVLDSSRPDMPG